MDETALITSAQQGDLNSFNTLVLHYQDAVFNTAVRILGDEDTAQDAAQEAFISAFQSIKSFRGGSFKAWILRTVTNACLDELRRQKRRPTTPLEPETSDGEEIDSPKWLADKGMTPPRKQKPTNSNMQFNTASMRFQRNSAAQLCWQTFREWITPKSQLHRRSPSERSRAALPAHD